MEQIFNPYLPLWEYIPDGEPHVFGDRLYIYGSHDRAKGEKYCEGHYAVWSCDVNNLKKWRLEGESYKRTQDPSNKEDKLQLWAPDVSKGPDGRYYLFYCFSFYPEIGVAVSDTPEGPFEFHGHVKYPDNLYGGKVLGDYLPFDPAVLTDDDGRVYLYYGFSYKKYNFDADEFQKMMNITLSEGAMITELESDMLTVKYEPKVLIPGGKLAKGTAYDGHAFFEASSIRKVKDKYYFVYSSELSHELCYAISDFPDRDFSYGGIIVSNGDVGINGREKPVYTFGNNHGGMVQIGDEWYIFYHRQTNGTEFSRQGCCEKITIDDDGAIKQVEITSCGLNGGALIAKGEYPSAIACHLTSETTQDKIDYFDKNLKIQTMISDDLEDKENPMLIKFISNSSVIGYKYFKMDDAKTVSLKLSGEAKGVIKVFNSLECDELIGEKEVDIKDENYIYIEISLKAQKGDKALYFTFEGDINLNFKSFKFD